MSVLNYKKAATPKSGFHVSHFSALDEIEFLTATNNTFEIIITPNLTEIGTHTSKYGISTISNTIIGIGTSSNKFNLRKNGSGFHIRLSPSQLNQITNIPLYELCKSPSELVDVFGREFIYLLEMLNETNDLNIQGYLIEEFFKNFILFSKPKQFNLTEILSYSNEIFTVKEFQNVSGLTERNLERFFQKNIGISPRDFFGIKRFNFLSSLLIKRKYELKNISLLQTALEVGYYDQSHFIRHCKKYTGLTPTKFFNNYDSELSGTYNF